MIETSYCFTVAAVDGVGNVGPQASGGATARFNLTVIGPPAGGPTNERFGASIDGFADLNGDGKSDLLIGSFSGQNAYIFYGSDTIGAAATPSVTITGPSGAGFGRQFIDVGDIDADGKDDFAISAPTVGNGRVYIFKGRTTWKATYSASTDADYIIELDATYAGSFFGASLARLGDFNGDGVDDFAVGAFGYGGSRGRVVIVLGKAGFAASAVDVHVIDGDAAYPSGGFGGAILGMGKFYTSTVGTTLVASGSVAGMSGRGRVYAFHGITGTGGTLSATMADHFLEGPADNSAYGQSLTIVGPISTLPGLAIGAGRSSSLGNGFVDLYYGNPMVGPFGVTPLRFTDSLASTSNDLFSRVILGSAFSGTAVTVSVIGDSKPDLIMAPFTESGGGPSRVYLVDGSRFSGLTSPSNVVTAADVILALPVDWKTLPAQRNGMIRDLDGNGYADFAIGENIAIGSGRVAIFW
jgi:hypothetical protein